MMLDYDVQNATGALLERYSEYQTEIRRLESRSDAIVAELRKRTRAAEEGNGKGKGKQHGEGELPNQGDAAPKLKASDRNHLLEDLAALLDMPDPAADVTHKLKNESDESYLARKEKAKTSREATFNAIVAEANKLTADGLRELKKSNERKRLIVDTNIKGAFVKRGFDVHTDELLAQHLHSEYLGKTTRAAKKPKTGDGAPGGGAPPKKRLTATLIGAPSLML